jgi:hypothetical protein
MVRLNLCSGCNFNFASTSTHAAHRTGKFENGTRRCMTPEEMQARGWTKTIEPVTRYREGKPYTDHLETWSIPISEQEQARLAAMREQRA